MKGGQRRRGSSWRMEYLCVCRFVESEGCTLFSGPLEKKEKADEEEGGKEGIMYIKQEKFICSHTSHPTSICHYHKK